MMWQEVVVKKGVGRRESDTIYEEGRGGKG